MNNVVKINNDATMAAMDKIVSKDDGSGGTSPNNNTEYIGKISQGKVVEDPHGSAGDLSSRQPATSNSTAAPNETSFHSHPSGTDGRSMWQQPPSKQDIQNTTGRINYVYGMRTGTIYIYNKSGVIATIPSGVFKK